MAYCAVLADCHDQLVVSLEGSACKGGSAGALSGATVRATGVWVGALSEAKTISKTRTNLVRMIGMKVSYDSIIA